MKISFYSSWRVLVVSLLLANLPQQILANVTRVTTDPNYTLNYVPIRKGDSLYLHLNLLAASSFKLASGNIQFKYKSAVLTNPTLFSNTLINTDAYSGISFTNPNPLDIDASDALGSLNFNFTGTTGQGLPISTSDIGTEIAVIRFKINDFATSPNLRTYVNGSQGTVVYNDAQQLLTTTGGDNYDFALGTKISYAEASFCQSATEQSPVFTGVSGGVYSAEAGLTLNATTGVITPSTSTPGSYQIYYAIPNAGGGKALAIVAIADTPVVTIPNLNAQFCSNENPLTLVGSPAGGTFTIDGITTSVLIPSALTSGSHSIVYTYTNSNGCEGKVTKSFTVSAQTVITTQPFAPSTTCIRSPINLTVVATGDNLTYQWYRSGSPIANETMATLNTESEAGRRGYHVVVSGVCGAVPSSTVDIAAFPPVEITTQPVSQSGCLGTGVTLSVGVNHESYMNYQWKLNGNDIVGAGNKSYLALETGSYSVHVYNGCNSDNSNAADVVINYTPSLISYPTTTTNVCVGKPLTLSVNFTDVTNCVWMKDGVQIQSGTSKTYTVPSSAATHAGTYNVVLTGCGEPVTSPSFEVVVNEVASITTQPAATTSVCLGAALKLKVVTAGKVSSYQWKKGTENIVGATQDTFAIQTTVLADTGTYSVVIVPLCGTQITSTAAVVKIDQAPAEITGTAFIVKVGETIPLANAITGGTWSSGNTDMATIAANGVVTGVGEGDVIISYTLVNSCGTKVVTKSITVTRDKVKISLKVFLEGAFNATTGKMNDDLRTGGLIPTYEPYSNLTSFNHSSGGESVAASVLATTGQNAIVDWVFVELRDKTTPSTVLHTRAALVQSDGDIVDVDGVSPLQFLDVLTDDYHVAVRHRNHLGFRTHHAVSLTATPIALDFTNGSEMTFGIAALLQKSSNLFVMYAGDADGNGVINAIDQNAWLLQFGAGGFLRPDFDLNGVVNAFDLNNFWLINNSIIQQLD
jgi:hypothetical protein